LSKAEGRVLIVDDEPDIANALARIVHREGLSPILAGDGTEALRLIRELEPEVLLTDFRMPGMDGMALMRKAKETAPELPVILLTGFADVRGAVAAIRAGAHDYLAKPFDHADVVRVVLRALNEHRLKLELKHLSGRVRHGTSLRETFGPSAAMAKLVSGIEQVAGSGFSVVIVGETGSGKEVVAQAIHRTSANSSGPFVPVDCGAIPEALLESELFGHERGAFTGADHAQAGKIESANGGTLFLDEMSNMTHMAQAKLLRVLQEKTLFRLGSTTPVHVDVRVLVACNRDLEELCRQGTFRADLYFRLSEFTLRIPPLRARKEDIIFLAKRFLDLTNVELGKCVRGFAASAVEQMLRYEWPGNVRQLRSVVRRAVLLSEDLISEEELGLDSRQGAWGESALVLESAGPIEEHEGLPLKEILHAAVSSVERRVIARTLKITGGNKSKAARLLQVDYKTLHLKVKEYGIALAGEQQHEEEAERRSVAAEF